MYFSPSARIRSRDVLKFSIPSFVLDEIGVNKNFKPSWWIARMTFLLSSLFVPSRFCSIEVSKAFGLADQSTILSTCSFGSKSLLESR